MGETSYDAVGVAIASTPVGSPRPSTQENEYYYTLAFRNTRGGDDGEDDDEKMLERLRFAEALAILRAVTAGGKEREAEVTREFVAAWVAKFRTPAPTPEDTIPVLYFRELVRELMVQRFDGIADLFLRTQLSHDRQHLFLSFRPSKGLLRATADRLRLPVAMMSEVDPGEEYWAADSTRSAVEGYRWSKADAQDELYRLFLAGKIPSEDAQLFDDEVDREDEAMWSRRLHALRRFCSPEVAKIVQRQPQGETVFLPYRNRPSLRYLYRQIDGAASDASPFRVADKIRLTKAIIDAEFDCDGLVEKGLLAHHFCIHTHQTDAIDTSIDALRGQWGALLSPFCLWRQGQIKMSQLPHYQPIVHIRNYFGEELALYCAFTSFCTHALQFLCCAALVAALCQNFKWSEASGVHTSVGFAAINTVFIQVFGRKWAVKERQLAVEWGVADVKHSDAPRPQFRGELSVSPITNRLETSYPHHRRQFKRLVSAVLLAAISVAYGAGGISLTTSTALADFVSHSHGNLQVVHVAYAILSKFLTPLVATLCKLLTDWENYKTQHEHDANLTLKFALIQTVNQYGMLWLKTFVRPFISVNACDGAKGMGCLDEAAHLLVTILMVELISSVWDLRRCAHESVQAAVRGYPEGHDKSRLLAARDDLETKRILDIEHELEAYEGVLFDYAQIVMMLGLIVWFAPLAPLSALLAWGIAVVQIRVDAHKLCHLTQRPFPTQKNSIGSWGIYLSFLGFGGWLHSAAWTTLRLTFASSDSVTVQTIRNVLLLHEPADGSSAMTEMLNSETKLLCIFVAFALVAFLSSLSDHRDHARHRQIQFHLRRQKYLEKKYMHNLDHTADAVWESLPSGRVFLNGVHLYLVTGNKAEEDAAEEILDELVQLQLRALQLQKEISELRATEASVGILVLEIGSINILPVMDALTNAVDTFLQLHLKNDIKDDRKRRKKKEKPVNTSVIKKNRSPQWTERFELHLDGLDDVLQVRVYDWELLGKNRRIGNANLQVMDVVATTPPAIPEADKDLKGQALNTSLAAELPLRMASFEMLIEMPEVLLASMHADLVKHGHPKLSLRCGVRLERLGRLLYQQQQLQAKVQQLKSKEAQFFEWK